MKIMMMMIVAALVMLAAINVSFGGDQMLQTTMNAAYVSLGNQSARTILIEFDLLVVSDFSRSLSFDARDAVTGIQAYITFGRSGLDTIDYYSGGSWNTASYDFPANAWMTASMVVHQLDAPTPTDTYDLSIDGNPVFTGIVMDGNIDNLDHLIFSSMGGNASVDNLSIIADPYGDASGPTLVYSTGFEAPEFALGDAPGVAVNPPWFSVGGIIVPEDTTPTPPTYSDGFGFGWWDSFGYAESANQIGSMGGTTAVTYNASYSSAVVQGWLDDAAANGIRTTAGITAGLVDAGDTTAITNYVQEFDTHPAISGWISYDDGHAGKHTELKAAYDAIKAASTKPVSLVFDSTAIRDGRLSTFADSYDIMLVEIYPCRVGAAEFTLLEGANWIKADIDLASAQAASLGKKWGAVLQAFGGESGSEWARLPTFNEAKFLLYYSIEKGAESAVFYPLYRTDIAPPVPTDVYPYGGVQWQVDVFRPLATEMDTLNMAIADGVVGGGLVVDDSADVLTSLYQDPDTDEYYLLALNSTFGSENPTFTVDITGFTATFAQLLFESELLIPIVAGEFSHAFADYGVHAFKLILHLDGDANGDGVVSAGDYASVQANFGNTGDPGILGDANGDGVVSAGDYASVQANFGNTAASAEVVPEPATMSLLALGGLAMLRAS